MPTKPKPSRTPGRTGGTSTGRFARPGTKPQPRPRRPRPPMARPKPRKPAGKHQSGKMQGALDAALTRLPIGARGKGKRSSALRAAVDKLPTKVPSGAKRPGTSRAAPALALVAAGAGAVLGRKQLKARRHSGEPAPTPDAVEHEPIPLGTPQTHGVAPVDGSPGEPA